MKKITLILSSIVAMLLSGCLEATPSSDTIQREQQERVLQEGTAATGMPAIKNFRERRLLKMIYELRDQDGLSTYTYIVNKMTGKLVFLCASSGFAISDATGYTNPDKVVKFAIDHWGTMTQAEPNGLYTPDTSNANWVMCLSDGKPRPVFISTEIVVSPFKLD